MISHNRIINGAFKNGTFSSWDSSNAAITDQYTHSGNYSAVLIGDTNRSFISQFVPVDFTEQHKFSVSLAKAGILQSPPLTISVAYYDAKLNFLGDGFFTEIPAGSLPNASEKWYEVYETTSPVPFEATQALIIIKKFAQAGSANVLVDDVNFFITVDTSETSVSGLTNDFQEFNETEDFPPSTTSEVSETNGYFDVFETSITTSNAGDSESNDSTDTLENFKTPEDNGTIDVSEDFDDSIEIETSESSSPLINRFYDTNKSENALITEDSKIVVENIPLKTDIIEMDINPITNKIYIINNESNNVTVIDGNTNLVVAKIPVGTNPQRILVNPLANSIYVANYGSNDISIIHGTTNTVEATIMLG